MLTRDDLAQLQHLLRPLHVRVANLAARGTVQLVDDSGQLQTLQIGDLEGGPYDDCEHLQPYGFSSVPLAGADTACVIFPNGDRGHALVVSVADRRYRPTGGKSGEVSVYNHKGAKITMTADGDIEVQPAPGRQVFIRQPGGAADRVVLKSDFDNHKHDAGTLAAPNGAVAGETGGAAAATGSQTLQVQ